LDYDAIFLCTAETNFVALFPCHHSKAALKQSVL